MALIPHEGANDGPLGDNWGEPERGSNSGIGEAGDGWALGTTMGWCETWVKEAGLEGRSMG